MEREIHHLLKSHDERNTEILSDKKEQEILWDAIEKPGDQQFINWFLEKTSDPETNAFAIEEFLISNARGKFSSEAIAYLQRFHASTLPAPEKIQEFKELIANPNVENTLRLYELTPYTRQINTNIIYRIELKKQGYFFSEPDVKKGQQILADAWHRSLTHEDGPELYKQACWSTSDYRYYNDIRNEANINDWSTADQIELNKIENIIITEMNTGSMPFRVREFIALTFPNILSSSTLELLGAAPPQIIHSGFNKKKLNEKEQEANSMTFDKIAEVLKEQASTIIEVNPENLDAHMRAYVRENIFQDNFTVEQARADAELALWVPDDEALELITFDTDRRINHIKSLFFNIPEFDFNRYCDEFYTQPQEAGGARSNKVIINRYKILRETWSLCATKPGFFQEFSPTNLVELISTFVPDHHYRSFITSTFEQALKSKQLTPELASCLVHTCDDTLLIDFWNKINHDPDYTYIFLGHIANPELREQLFHEVNIPARDCNAAENFLESLDSIKYFFQNKPPHQADLAQLEHEFESFANTPIVHQLRDEYRILLKDYLQFNRNREKYTTFAAQQIGNLIHILEAKTPLLYKTGYDAEFATLKEIAAQISLFITSSNDLLAEQTARVIEHELDQLPVPQPTNYQYEKLLTALIVRCTPEQKNLLHQKMSDYLHSYGLDEYIPRLVNAWKLSYKGNDFTPELFKKVEENLEVMHAIERQHPGGCKILLEEFGIKNFARYGERILIKQLEEKDDTSKPYGVILLPEDDWNGAFYQNRQVFESLLEQLETAGISLRVTESKNGLRAAAQTKKMKTKYGQASFCCAGGHGTEDGLALGSNSAKKTLPTISRADLKNEQVQRSGDFLKDGSQIILISCSTGKDGGFAQKLSEAFGRAIEVTGPDVPTNIKSIKLISTDPIRFKVEYADPDTVRQYVAGVKS